LVLYLICCLGLLRLRARNVTMDGEPFHAPGGWLVPLAASLIIVWMLTTLRWQELVGAFVIVAVSAVVYSVHYRLRKPAAAEA
jgi:APA family basic amino acid/polyamine antiporter